MGQHGSLLLLLCQLLLLARSSSALDMSITNFDHQWRTEPDLTALYESWMIKHGKAYNALGEKETRFHIFKDNLRFIDDHNRQNRSYRLGLTRFADLTNEEYRRMYLGTKMSDRHGKRFGGRYEGAEPPRSVDWRTMGAVADVKDQGSCGSCWAFSTVAAVEGINKIVTGEMTVLSEQELIDCDTMYNQGCNGGLMDYAYAFIINNRGIDTAIDYPYTGFDGDCDSYRKGARVVSIDDYEDVHPNNETALQAAVARQPVSVAIEAGGRIFQFYKSGVFSGDCGTKLDHGVAVVGYGTEDGKDYWIVRNSWGRDWGEGGYVRMERNLNTLSAGKCGIAMQASYPVKRGANPPKPAPSPPSPVRPPIICDNDYTCSPSSTCCCVYEVGKSCVVWGCCPLEAATCCDDHNSCCPADFPVCDTTAGTCSMSKENPLGVKALKRTRANFRSGIRHGDDAMISNS